MSTRAPCLSSSSAVASPIPDEPPDIVLTCSNHGSRWDDHLPVMMARLPLSDVKSRSLAMISVMSKGQRILAGIKLAIKALTYTRWKQIQRAVLEDDCSCDFELALGYEVHIIYRSLSRKSETRLTSPHFEQPEMRRRTTSTNIYPRQARRPTYLLSIAQNNQSAITPELLAEPSKSSHPCRSSACTVFSHRLPHQC